MKPTFSNDFFAGNRQRLRQNLAADVPIVVTANGLLQRNTDTSFPFQQDGSFWYLTGVDEPDVVLVIDVQDEYLIVPHREVVREAFDGAIDEHVLSKQSGIKTVLGVEEGWERLGTQLQKTKAVATLAANPTYLDFFGIYSNPARRTVVRKLKSYVEGLELIDLRLEIAHMRMVKQPQEIATLQTAIDITSAAITDATQPKKMAKYVYEYELEAAIAHGFRSRGARGHAFDPIVASGASAATIHSLTNNEPLPPDGLVVIDVGAEYNHYAADITRTKSFGTPSSRQQAVYRAVLEVQEYAFGLQKPGALVRENEKLVEAFMGKKLVELKLIKKAEREAIRKYYPHACSHFLGLDPHDASDYDVPLEAGMVLTVEPGIYIPEEGIGVRLEDDVLITKTGYQILSDSLPRVL